MVDFLSISVPDFESSFTDGPDELINMLGVDSMILLFVAIASLLNVDARLEDTLVCATCCGSSDKLSKLSCSVKKSTSAGWSSSGSGVSSRCNCAINVLVNFPFGFSRALQY